MEPNKEDERRKTILPPPARWRRAWPYAAALLAAALLPSSFFYAGSRDRFSPGWFRELPGRASGLPATLAFSRGGTGGAGTSGPGPAGEADGPRTVAAPGSGLDYILNPGEPEERTATAERGRGETGRAGGAVEETPADEPPEQENLPGGGNPDRRLVLGTGAQGAAAGSGSAGHALAAADKDRARQLELLAPVVPVSDPEPVKKKAKGRATGEVSSFAWRAKRKKNPGRGIKGLNDKAPRYQLSEAFAMASIASASRGPEYVASYSGATYDGNETAGDALEGGEPVVPTTPNAGFAGDLMGGAARMLDDMARCREVIGVNTDKITLEAGEMQKAIGNMDFADTPGCCPWEGGRLSAWNSDVDAVVSRCSAINDLTKEISWACGKDTYNHLKCEKYGEMKIDCEGWDCGAELAVWAVIAFFFLMFIGIAWFPLLVLASAGLFGTGARGAVNNFVRSFTGYDAPLPPADVQGGEQPAGEEPKPRFAPREQGESSHHDTGGSNGHGPDSVDGSGPTHNGN